MDYNKIFLLSILFICIFQTEGLSQYSDAKIQTDSLRTIESKRNQEKSEEQEHPNLVFKYGPEGNFGIQTIGIFSNDNKIGYKLSLGGRIRLLYHNLFIESGLLFDFNHYSLNVINNWSDSEFSSISTSSNSLTTPYSANVLSIKIPFILGYRLRITSDNYIGIYGGIDGMCNLLYSLKNSKASPPNITSFGKNGTLNRGDINADFGISFEPGSSARLYLGVDIGLLNKARAKIFSPQIVRFTSLCLGITYWLNSN